MTHTNKLVLKFDRNIASALLILVLFSAGCAKHDESYAADYSVQRTANYVKPGDNNYPDLNPSPMRTFKFKAIVPPSISVRFVAGYGATLQDLSCMKTVGLGEKRNVYTSLPLKLSKIGDVYEGEVAIDRILLGRCQWKFSGVSYIDLEFGPGAAVDSGLIDDDGQDRHQEEVSLDIWYYRKPNLAYLTPSGQLNGVVIPINFHDLNFWRDKIPTEFYESIPIAQRNNDSGYLSQNTKVVTATFHNLNAMLAGSSVTSTSSYY